MKIFTTMLLALALALTVALGTYFVAPAQFLRGAIALERWAASLQRFELEIPGFRIAYLDSGGSGPPLVLVHGFGGDKDNWTRVARHLRGSVRVIALDLPGYGESDAPADARYAITDQVERLRAFITGLGLTRVNLGGNSMGGNIVATYAATYPNTVTSLWLVANSGVNRAPTSELRQRIAETGHNALVPRTQAEYREMMGWVMASPPPLPDAVVEVLGARAVAASALRERQFAQLVEEANTLEPRLGGLPIPTHVLWGEQDRVLHPYAVDVLMGLLPQSSRTVLPGIGHLPMIEAPKQAALDYLAFRKHFRL